MHEHLLNRSWSYPQPCVVRFQIKEEYSMGRLLRKRKECFEEKLRSHKSCGYSYQHYCWACHYYSKITKEATVSLSHRLGCFFK